MDKVIIYGAGKQAELVFYYFSFYQLAEVVGFTVEKEYKDQDVLMGLPVIDFEMISQTFPPDNYKIFIAIGGQKMNDVRKNAYSEVKHKGYSLVNLICPTAMIFPNVIIGVNVFVGPSNGIAPFSRIGNNVTLIASKLGHHSVIKDNVLISSSTVGANVVCEENVFIGLGTVITSGVRIGRNSIIGMGSLIKKDVKPFSVNIPDRKMRTRIVDGRKFKLG